MLTVEHIAFSYGGKTVLSDVSFTVRSGETVALVGANGAGKTTLLRVMAGLLFPSRGSVRLDGTDAFAQPMRFRRSLGYLPEGAPADPGSTVRKYLKFRAVLKGEQTRRIRHRVKEAMEACGIADLAERRIGTLSFGQRKRTALAEAVLLRPRVLLLDDVLAGLDPVARSLAGGAVESVASFASIVVSGHEIDELAARASRFIVLKDGMALSAATAAEARKAMS